MAAPLLTLDDELLGDSDGAGDADEFSSSFNAEEPTLTVVLPERKRRKTVAPEAKLRASLLHRALLLTGVAVAMRMERRALADELVAAQALSIEPKASVAASLKAVWKATRDPAVCVAWTRRWHPCRLVASLPFVPWKPRDDAEADMAADDALRLVYWLEYWHEEAWLPVRPDSAARERMTDVDALSYVVAVGHGQVLDVTPRYCRAWSVTCKRQRHRAAERWWAHTLALLCTPAAGPAPPWAAWDALAVRNAQLAEPIPRSASALKAHPTYVRADHVPRYCALEPEAQPVGRSGDHDVYLRAHVVAVHSADKWVELGKELRPEHVGAPAKRVPSRSKMGQDTLLYGPWQVRDTDVGESVDGHVPKNAFGNVYLYRPDMMPRGCVLLDVPGLTLALASRLGIDAAKAVTSFTFKRGMSYPAYSPGLVVARENAELLRMAAAENAQLVERRRSEHQDKVVRKSWRRLVRRALVWQRLNQRGQ